MSATALNFGLVGCGFMGSMHAQIYARLPGVRLAAAADARPEAGVAKLLKLGYSVPVYPSLDALLAAHPEVTVVDLCTPLDQHETDALLALRARKHLFCEKPLAPSLAAADRIRAAAAAAGVIAQVGHCLRFWPEYQALRRLVRDGAAGKLLSLSLQRQAGRPGYTADDWANQESRSGGAAVDLHIHDTDFVLALLGRPRAVHSRGTFDYSGPAHIFTVYDYQDVAVAAEGGWNYPANYPFRMAFQALFEEACVDYDSSRSPTLTLTPEGRAPEALPFDAPAAGSSSTGEGNLSSLGGYFNELQAFVRSVDRESSPEDATLDDARASLAVVLAEIESARTGRTVAVSS